MKHKVKTFVDTQCQRLEDEINKWLAEHSNVGIVDIKYSTSQCGNSGGSIYGHYSALIHYMEN